MEIRDAVGEDAEAACEVTRRSIAELCAADHRGDTAVLAAWLSNKTPENFKLWIARRSNSVLVAVEKGTIVAVGAVTDAGDITLNYVLPEARFQGVSRALLAALEARVRRNGNLRCTLTSTVTARRFYSANGYTEAAPPETKSNMTGYPMSKVLGP